MQKNWIWIIIAVAVVVLLGYFFLGNGSLSTLGNTSLRSLLTSNATQQCQFSNGSSSGTIYVSAGRMRGDFAASGATAQSHMVIANNIAYLWIDGSSQGYRMPFEDLASTSRNNAAAGLDADAKVASKCAPWAAQDSVFSLPTDVTFSAIGAATGDMAPVVPVTNSHASGTSASAGASANASESYYAQVCGACNAIGDKTLRLQCIAKNDCPAQ